MKSSSGSPPHLMRRFFWSLRAHEPEPSQEQWLLGLCSPAEQDLYRASSRQDRSHAVECAVAADRLVSADPDLAALSDDERAAIVVAAALHDVGKTPAKLSTSGRVAATLAKPFVGERTESESEAGLWTRFGVYKAHPVIGAEMLAQAGSDPLVVAWAREHHVDPSQRTIDQATARVLEQADE